MHSDAILSVRNLRTYFKLDEGTLKAVDGWTSISRGAAPSA